jgi:hypothetical protein
MQELCDRGFLTEAHLEGLFGLSRRMPGFGSEIYINAKPVDARLRDVGRDAHLSAGHGDHRSGRYQGLGVADLR